MMSSHPKNQKLFLINIGAEVDWWECEKDEEIKAFINGSVYFCSLWNSRYFFLSRCVYVTLSHLMHLKVTSGVSPSE